MSVSEENNKMGQLKADIEKRKNELLKYSEEADQDTGPAVRESDALKEKMRQFQNTKFLVWTGASLVEQETNEKAATLTRSFFEWVKNDWDEPGDNIYLWDFFELQTEGGLYFKTEYAKSPDNSHPSNEFSKRVYPFLCNRIVDIIRGDGDKNQITGED